jgi:hypothetical protein
MADTKRKFVNIADNSALRVERQILGTQRLKAQRTPRSGGETWWNGYNACDYRDQVDGA